MFGVNSEWRSGLCRTRTLVMKLVGFELEYNPNLSILQTERFRSNPCVIATKSHDSVPWQTGAPAPQEMANMHYVTNGFI